jgi:hypothetical protein
MIKQLFAGLCAFALLPLLSSPLSAQAQTAVENQAAGPFSYDVTQEVTLNGTVSSVLTGPSPGMIMGSHLLLTTSSGPVDASLGMFAMRGKGAVSVVVGQQVEVTGVMKTMNGKQVFLVRIVKAGGQVYTIRNERGFPIPPQARESASQTTAGEAL